MPNGLPIGPVIFAIVFAVFSMTFVRKIYVHKTIKWVRRFRRVAYISSLFTAILFATDVLQLRRAPHQDVFAFYLMSVIILSVALVLAGVLLRTIHKYRWYDPNSAPEQWEQPQAVLQQDSV